jgi:hypothetical protein
VRVRRADLILALVAGATLAAFLPKVFWPGSAIYRDVLTEQVLIYSSSIAKLVFQFLGCVFALRTSRHLEDGNPARRPWALLGAGLLSFFVGQAILGFFVLVLRQPSPFPSAADVFFLAGYPLLMSALVGFIRAYREAGLAVGTAAEHAGLALGSAAAFVVVDWVLVRPILAASVPAAVRYLNAAYPTLDFGLLVPILILIRITARFRGGLVAGVWTMLLTGFVCLCAGDIAYAYLSTTGDAWLDPLTDAAYVLSYVFIARGTMAQYELLTR